MHRGIKILGHENLKTPLPLDSKYTAYLMSIISGIPESCFLIILGLIIGFLLPHSSADSAAVELVNILLREVASIIFSCPKLRHVLSIFSKPNCRQKDKF